MTATKRHNNADDKPDDSRRVAKHEAVYSQFRTDFVALRWVLYAQRSPSHSYESTLQSLTKASDGQGIGIFLLRHSRFHRLRGREV